MTGNNELTVVYDDGKVNLEAILEALRKGGVVWRGRPSPAPGPGPSSSVDGGSNGGGKGEPVSAIIYR